MSIPKLLFAILLNLAVMPGAGQIFIKEKKRGYVFVILVAGLLLAATYHFTLFFKEELLAVKISNDIMGMAKIMEGNLWAKHDLALRGYLFGGAALYVASLVDLVLIYIDCREETTSGHNGSS
jgi:hypothetical protein